MKKLKEKLHQIIFGVDTPAGRGFDIVLLILILASITILMLESVQEINTRWLSLFRMIDWIITILFTIEYALRLWTSNNRQAYVFSFFGMIDLFSILPMYLSLFIIGSQTLAVIRVLRLLRVFRVLKLVQFLGEASKMKAALRSSSRKIVIFIFFVLIVSVFIGTLMYLIEGREHGFTSIPRSVYWAIVTLTTVGYGDIAPQTTIGQFFAMILMITGYGVIAVPTGLVTAEIIRDSYAEEKRKAESRKTCVSCGEDERADANFCSTCGNAF